MSISSRIISRGFIGASVFGSSRLNIGRFSSTKSRFPGASSELTSEMNFIDKYPQFDGPWPCFQIMNEMGQITNEAEDPKLDKETCIHMYKIMNKLSAFDVVFYDAQRQGRISFYMTSMGEEGAQIGSASALKPQDEVMTQYREAGVFLWRGYTLQDLAHQCFANDQDPGKGRQMPVHYGNKAIGMQTVSSPLATQIPHASGVGYAFKIENESLELEDKRCSIVYFGEGAASEGDFHGALNFAATLECPTLFFCRNNGYAISTPTHDQYRGDGIVARGPGYGVHSIRVDGNDILAVHAVTKAARELAVTQNCPVLIEAMTYRGGHHSTSDDASRYRKNDELAYWQQNDNPIQRMRLYMESQGWWDSDQESELKKANRAEVLASLSKAEAAPKPDIEELFTDVHDEILPNLQKQKDELMEHIAKYPEEYKI